MKFLFDLFPVLLFFGVFTWAKGSPEAAQAAAERYLSVFSGAAGVDPASAPILLATAVAIVASFLQVVYLKLRKRKVEPMLWVSLVIIVLFGGATIYFSSEDFIKWKPTVLYWLFGLALCIAHLVWNRNLIRMMMEKQIKLPDGVWMRLNYLWVAFFALMGVINLYVAFWGGFETSTWVSFKLFGGIGLMFAFVVAQSLYLSRYIRNS